MMSSGECQWAHWVSGVTEAPWIIGSGDDPGSGDMLLWFDENKCRPISKAEDVRLS